MIYLLSALLTIFANVLYTVYVCVVMTSLNDNQLGPEGVRVLGPALTACTALTSLE